MSIIETAKLKGITVKNHNEMWRVMFGDNLMFDTTMTSTIEKFLNSCELIERENALGLRIDGFVHCWIEKT